MFSTRRYIKEEMDNFETQGAELHDSLNKLSFINTFLGNTSITLNAVTEVLENEPQKVFHIIDLGCGAGDNLRAIATWCFENNRAVKLTGIDGNNHILSYAEQQNSAKQIMYKQDDVLGTDFELESCDILISSHFIYRFTDQELVNFINRSKIKVEKAIIFSELQRHIIPYGLFKLMSGVLFFNKMMKQDGLNAIKSSFKKNELQHILQRLNVTSYQLEWKWAFRYLVTIKM